MSDRDYYEILGLTPRADGPMVDQAYWHLARKYQVLAATNTRAERMLDELNEAYGVLGNPRLREQYDAFRDDVLVRQGMIKPVRSKPVRAKSDAAKTERRSRTFALPAVAVQNWPMYATSFIICSLAFAGAWQGVSFVFVAVALVAGLGVSLAPTVKSRVPDVTLRMPSMPSMPTMPTMQAPKLAMPSLSDLPLPVARNDGGMDADDLRISTAATIARWRKSVGLKQMPAEFASADAEPDSTLVDIVQAERDIDDPSEPLTAVLDILRGSNRPVSSR